MLHGQQSQAALLRSDPARGAGWRHPSRVSTWPSMAQQPCGSAFGFPMAMKTQLRKNLSALSCWVCAMRKLPPFPKVCNPLFSVAGTSLVEGKDESTKAGLMLIFCCVWSGNNVFINVPLTASG